MSLRSLVFLLSVVALGCGPQTSSQAIDDSDVEVVPDGKADNYFSTTASEYWVDGTAKVVLEDRYQTATAAQKLARANALAELKTIQIGWFLNVRLTDKEVGDAAHTDANANTYPGYHAIVRTGAWTIQNVRATDDGRTYAYDVRLQVAGQKNLLDELPGTVVAGGKQITLAMGVVSNADLARLDPEHEWFRDGAWDAGSFDPAKLAPSQLENIELTFTLQNADDDAYFDLQKLYADGKLTIDAHYGWDYWDRYDLTNSQDLYDQLVGQGFQSPAATWAEYHGDMGPLTKQVTIDGKAITIEVKIFHGSGNGTAGFDPETDQGGAAMEQAMLASLATSDVIIASIHSGQYYGFALADWNKTSRGALDYPALSAAKMPTDRYQIVMASGCDTFSIGQAFRENANKPNLANLNVITTNTFSNAGTNEEVMNLLDMLYAGRASKFTAKPVSAMLQKMNGSEMGSMYGVHGVDGDPRLHPFAQLDTLGQSCTKSSQCGGDGNRCTKISSSSKVCSATCLADAACPSGYRCRDVAATGTNTIVGKQCLR